MYNQFKEYKPAQPEVITYEFDIKLEPSNHIKIAGNESIWKPAVDSMTYHLHIDIWKPPIDSMTFHLSYRYLTPCLLKASHAQVINISSFSRA